MHTYRFESSGLTAAPGFIAFARHAWLDRPSWALDLLASVWPTAPAWALVAALANKGMALDGEAVVATYDTSESKGQKTPETWAEAGARREREGAAKRDEAFYAGE